MKEYEIWIKKSEQDLDTAKYNLSGEKIDAGLFFLQQSAEKALKAIYIKKFKELLKIHDLVIISRKLNAPPEIINFCKKLTPLYQFTRYPDVSETNKVENINEFIFYSEEVLKWAKKKLKE